MEHAWDFYKPDLHSEYPEVDGPLSNMCYLKAVDICYNRYLDKLEKSVRNLRKKTHSVVGPKGVLGSTRRVCLSLPLLQACSKIVCSLGFQ